MIKAISSAGNLSFKSLIGLKIPVRSINSPISFQAQADSFVKSTNTPKLKSNDISFGYNFELKNPSGIPCAYCGKHVLSREDLYELQNLHARDLTDRLEYFASQDRTALPSQNRGALDLLEKCAFDYPDKDGKTLLPIAYTRSRNRMLIKQAGVYSKVEKLAQELNSDELLKYIESVKEQDAVLNPQISIEELSDFLANKINIQFRKDVIKQVNKIAHNDTNKENLKKWNKVVEEINKLPSSKNDPDAYLVKFISKALRKDPKMENELVLLSDDAAPLFYSKLLFPFASSAEHIKAFSDNGKSHYSNYLVTHVHCNGDRGNMPWIKFMQSDPKKFDHVVKSLQVIANDSSIAKGLEEIKVPSYIKQVTRQLVIQSRSSANDPNVKNFLSNLNTVTSIASQIPDVKLPKREELVIQSAQIKKEIKSRLVTLLSLKDSYKFNQASQSALESVFQAVKDDRVQKFKNTISHLPDDTEGQILKDYFTELRIKDPIIGMKKPHVDSLKNLLSNAYNDKYKAKIETDLTYMFPDGVENPQLQSVVKKAPRRFAFSRQADGLYLKMLVDAKRADETFDRHKMISYLDIKPLPAS